MDRAKFRITTIAAAAAICVIAAQASLWAIEQERNLSQNNYGSPWATNKPAVITPGMQPLMKVGELAPGLVSFDNNKILNTQFVFFPELTPDIIAGLGKFTPSTNLVSKGAETDDEIAMNLWENRTTKVNICNELKAGSITFNNGAEKYRFELAKVDTANFGEAIKKQAGVKLADLELKNTDKVYFSDKLGTFIVLDEDNDLKRTYVFTTQSNNVNTNAPTANPGKPAPEADSKKESSTLTKESLYKDYVKTAKDMGFKFVPKFEAKGDGAFKKVSNKDGSITYQEIDKDGKVVRDVVSLDPKQGKIVLYAQGGVVMGVLKDSGKPQGFYDRNMYFAPKVSELPAQYQTYLKNFEKRGRPLTDEKLQMIWSAAKELDIDPVYFLAILASEGTGSFNTKADPRGGQPHGNFKTDLARAITVIKREMKEWRDNGEKGDWLHWVNRGHAGEDYRAGYAEDPRWFKNVRTVYNGKGSYSDLGKYPDKAIAYEKVQGLVVALQGEYDKLGKVIGPNSTNEVKSAYAMLNPDFIEANILATNEPGKDAKNLSSASLRDTLTYYDNAIKVLGTKTGSEPKKTVKSMEILITKLRDVAYTK